MMMMMMTMMMIRVDRVCGVDAVVDSTGGCQEEDELTVRENECSFVSVSPAQTNATARGNNIITVDPASPE
jgi:hypothetical protein